MTLDELRKHFWWLGNGEAGSHLVALENNRVTVEITQHTWSLRTGRYERSVERELGALGFKVAWRRAWSTARRRDLEDARMRTDANRQPFDEGAFIEAMRVEERARLEREENEDNKEG